MILKIDGVDVLIHPQVEVTIAALAPPVSRDQKIMFGAMSERLRSALQRFVVNELREIIEMAIEETDKERGEGLWKTNMKC